MAALVRTSFVICSALILLASPGVRAGTAQHHGLAVNGEAGYEECLACHDGVLAPSVSPCLASVCLFRGPHPVARAYPPPDKIDQFASREEVERAGIRLLNGQTDCISCHDLFGAKRYHLRLGTDGSRLCFACHRK
jgi:predicted CXXCH cytochrome family protein